MCSRIEVYAALPGTIPMSYSHDAVAPARSGLVVLAVLLVYVVWGSTYLAIRFALEGGAQPLTMVSGTRFIVAGSVLYSVLRWRSVAAPTCAQWKNVALMGAALLLLGSGMVVSAERSVSSGLAVATVPLWMDLFGALRGQHASGGEWLGIVIGFVGVMWLNAGIRLTATPCGLVLLVIAPIGWAFGSVWSCGRDLPSPFMTAAGQMLCGGVLLVSTGLLIGERPQAWPSPQGVLAVAYRCMFGSIVAFTAYVWLLHHVRPALAGSYAYVNPVIAVSLGAWLGQERFRAQDIAAMAVIMAGVLVVIFAKARR
ncbi:drug/metabolite exporter YedA [Xanthomonas oryzae]|uniref:drug/metabolite exporter YedA n=1 Tax=Xanthomonas oryzae TaxID=347 RepID=UPI000463BD57|nr:drug/metabolite exporter YedA [Xanthomonas oryzae]UWI56633.1 drug/metabolite exporter YedA [Xanthomonas oryzae pv. oryzae]